MDDGKSKKEMEIRSSSDGDSAQCGYLGWRPKCLRSLTTPPHLLAAICAVMFMQGFSCNGLIWCNLSTWERRYSLSSTEVAWVTATYDLSAVVFTLIYAYVGQFLHNGKLISLGLLVMSMGSMIIVLPQILSDPYVLGTASIPLCDLDGNETTTCVQGESSFYGFFILAQIFHACGGAAAYCISLPYLDSQVHPKKTPLYIGIAQCFGVLGPCLGFILAGLSLTIYVDVLKVDTEPDLDPSDPRWVGAWWICHILASVFTFFVSFIVLCFPRRLPASYESQKERDMMVHKGSAMRAMVSGDNMGRSLSELWAAVKVIFTNPVWLTLVIGGTLEIAAVVGFGSFFPKIIQFQFSKSPAESAIYSGAAVIPAALVGTLLGGYIPKLLNLRIRGLLVQALICSIVGLSLAWQFLLTCATPNIAGVTVNYYYNGTNYLEDPDVYSPCNIPCNCTTESYDPICGADGVEYFLPCFGGCTNSTESGDDEEIFSQCSCIPTAATSNGFTSDDLAINSICQQPCDIFCLFLVLFDAKPKKDIFSQCSCIPTEASNPTNPHKGWAINGICQQPCDIFWLFLVLFFLISLATFVALTSGTSAIIRCVPERHKTLATGFLWTILRLFGQAPAPIIVGMIFDASCLVWQESCGERGACWIYDSESVSKGITSALVITKSSSCICAVIALLLYRKPMDGDEDGDGDIIKEEIIDGDIIKEEIIDDKTLKKESGDLSGVKSNDKMVQSEKAINNGDIIRRKNLKHDEGYMNGGYEEAETTQL